LENLVLFASGGGSNALKIIEFFQEHDKIKVTGIITNNKEAGVINIAKSHHIPYQVVSRKTFNDPSIMVKILDDMDADYLILAGFLLLVPPFLIQLYKDKMINIHPSLLPKYGGKGMYGINVHKAVVANKEIASGPTIHLVNEEYDKGKILFQKGVDIYENDTPEIVAGRVLKLEHKYFAPTIEHYIESKRNEV
jgi:phosphoribosylglycinamide formyltransferase 1